MCVLLSKGTGPQKTQAVRIHGPPPNGFRHHQQHTSRGEKTNRSRARRRGSARGEAAAGKLHRRGGVCFFLPRTWVWLKIHGVTQALVYFAIYQFHLSHRFASIFFGVSKQPSPNSQPCIAQAAFFYSFFAGSWMFPLPQQSRLILGPQNGLFLKLVGVLH